MDDDVFLISDDIPVMDRGYLDRGFGWGWDEGCAVLTPEEYKREVAQRRRARRGHW